MDPRADPTNTCIGCDSISGLVDRGFHAGRLPWSPDAVLPSAGHNLFGGFSDTSDAGGPRLIRSDNRLHHPAGRFGGWPASARSGFDRRKSQRSGGWSWVHWARRVPETTFMVAPAGQIEKHVQKAPLGQTSFPHYCSILRQSRTMVKISRGRQVIADTGKSVRAANNNPVTPVLARKDEKNHELNHC